MFYLIIFFSSLLSALTYSPNDDLNTSERDFTPTLDCYYQKKENISEYGYTLQCYDVADVATSKTYVVTKDLNNTAITTDSSNISLVDSSLYSSLHLTDSNINDGSNSLYDWSYNYYNNSDVFDQSLVGSYNTDVGTMYYTKSGVFDKAIAMNTQETWNQTLYNSYLFNSNIKVNQMTNNILNSVSSKLDGLSLDSKNINSALADSNVRLDSIAGNTLATGINSRQTAYNTYQTNGKLDTLIDGFTNGFGDGDGDGSIDGLSEGNFSISGLKEVNTSVIDDFKKSFEKKASIYQTTISDLNNSFSSVYSSIDDAKNIFNNSLTTIDDLKNNDLQIRTGQLVDTNINVFGHDVNFDMYSSFVVFKPIGTLLFTLMFLYFILIGSFNLLIKGR